MVAGVVCVGGAHSASAQPSVSLPEIAANPQPFQIDSQTIVVAGGVGASWIGYVEADGSKPRVIYNYRGGGGPEVSPDGARVTFWGYVPPPLVPNTGVFVMNVDGSNLRLVAFGDDPRWSPDGKQIAYFVGGQHGFELWVVNADGSGDHELAPGFDSPDWSPDGSTLAFDNGKQVFVMPPSGGTPVQLTHLSADDFGGGARWSPDGTHIAFTVYHQSTNSLTLAEVNPDGTGERTLFNMPNGFQPGYSWNPDGQGFVMVDENYSGLTFVGLDGSVNSRISGSGNDPSWVRLTATHLPSCRAGYRLAGADGGVMTFGDAGFSGSAAPLPRNAPMVSLAAAPSGTGYWLVGADGGVFAFGHPGFFGSAGGTRLNQPVVGIAATPDGQGYWLVARDGGVFSYGDAHFFGSAASPGLGGPVVGMAATPDGGGYWLVDAAGNVAAFGDAVLYGSMHGLHLNQPVVGIASSPDGEGYWLAARDGGVFAFGDAPFLESAVGVAANPVVTLARRPQEATGWWMTAARCSALSILGFVARPAGYHWPPPSSARPERAPAGDQPGCRTARPQRTLCKAVQSGPTRTGRIRP
jgi:hypothetical protein